jgi:hypothetical protein
MNKLSMNELETVAGSGTCYGLQYNYGDKGTACLGVFVP